MLLSSTPGLPFLVLHSDFDDTFGCYLIEPGHKPCICLSNRLQIGSTLYNEVYEFFVKVHNSIPPDSPIRYFPWEWFYEELNQEIINPLPLVTKGPELEFIGRAGRRWKFTSIEIVSTVRIIGKAG